MFRKDDNMSTSASVFQMDTFGKLTGIRVHMDGNLEQLGVTLYHYYDHMTMSKVIEQGISQMKTIMSYPSHSR